MSNPRKVVVDTMVLRKANASLANAPIASRDFSHRLALLKRIIAGAEVPLHSQKLLAEYGRQVLSPRNDYVRTFVEVLLRIGRENWPPWRGSEEARFKKSRFPAEDRHVLRTSYVKGDRTTLYTEEGRILKRKAATLLHFDVSVVDPTKNSSE